MKLIVAECSVKYQGRGSTTLAPAVRLIMVKRDGSVCVHADDRAYKPLNWMLAPCEFTEQLSFAGDTVWLFESKTETLEIVLHQVHHETHYTLEALEPGLSRRWTEFDVQAWIAENVEEVFGEGFLLVGREVETGAGKVDLLVREGNVFYVVEVKRKATLGAVDQALRYKEGFLELTGFSSTVLGSAEYEGERVTQVVPVVAALDIRPRTLSLAERRGVICYVVMPRV